MLWRYLLVRRQRAEAEGAEREEEEEEDGWALTAGPDKGEAGAVSADGIALKEVEVMPTATHADHPKLVKSPSRPWPQMFVAGPSPQDGGGGGGGTAAASTPRSARSGNGWAVEEDV